MNILLLGNNFDKKSIYKYYIKKYNLDLNTFFYLNIPNSKKLKSDEIKEYLLNEVKPFIEENKIDCVLVTDSKYFMTLTKAKKVENLAGTCLYSDLVNCNCYHIYSYKIYFYNSVMFNKNADLVINSILNSRNLINIDSYITKLYTDEGIKKKLEELLKFEKLAIDIETYSLKFFNSGLKTISFSTSEKDAFVFEIDKERGKPNLIIRNYLKLFFEKYQGIKIFHNAGFDYTILIYNLFMNNIRDMYNLLYGLEILHRNTEDTFLMAYLCLNNTYRNELDLKSLSYELLGDYCVDNIKEIEKIPLEELLTYNGKDTIGTFYIYNKFSLEIIKENQLNIYKNIFLPSLKDVIQMQLTGIPIDKKRVISASEKLNKIKEDSIKSLSNNERIISFEKKLKEKELIKVNSKLKKLVKTIDDIEDIKFNINSHLQLSEFLYEELGFEPINYTKKGNSSVNKDTLEELKEIYTEKENNFFISNILNILQTSKLLNDFIPKFLNSIDWYDNRSYLHGNFNLGGTISGRLSSNNPNLQNIPSGNTKHGKIIKECVSAPKGWILVGFDYTSLEDKINCLQTKDPNKRIIYLEKYDSHCFRTYYYFPKEIPRFEVNPENINKIKKDYPDLRYASKEITFLLTYGGNHRTIMRKKKKSRSESLEIENNFFKLYKVSVEWKLGVIKEASKNGYVTCAFGLKLRTPMLSKVIINSKTMPYKASKEAKAAINAKGQSYSLLTSRACISFMNNVRVSKYKFDIYPVMNIHDALYFMVKLKPEILQYVNIELVKEFNWQDLEEIRDKDIKLGGELSIFYPDWSQETSIPNDASLEYIENTINQVINKGE